MILYYSPGACSLADHIAPEEADMKFDLEKVELQTHKLGDGRSYYEINPKGYVPALQFDDGEVLTENVAILTVNRRQVPGADAARAVRPHHSEMLAYLQPRSTKRSIPYSALPLRTREGGSQGGNRQRKLQSS